MVLRQSCILNEVLSLNAQEYSVMSYSIADRSILNEVLSLNAQECSQTVTILVQWVSSMKS